MIKICLKFIITIFISFLLLPISISACTVFNASSGDIVLAGRNMDWYTQENFIAFFPVEEGKFGRVYFGWNEHPSWYQGGMNEKGVMFAYLYAPYLPIRNSLLKPVYRENYGNLMKKCMEECSNLDEVLDVFDDYNLEFLENCQLITADNNGDSAIIEGDDIILKEGNYQVVTNFLYSHPDLGGHPCWRYDTAVQMLEEMSDLTVEYFTSICDATQQEGSYPTQ